MERSRERTKPGIHGKTSGQMNEQGSGIEQSRAEQSESRVERE